MHRTTFKGSQALVKTLRLKCYVLLKYLLFTGSLFLGSTAVLPPCAFNTTRLILGRPATWSFHCSQVSPNGSHTSGEVLLVVQYCIGQLLCQLIPPIKWILFKSQFIILTSSTKLTLGLKHVPPSYPMSRYEVEQLLSNVSKLTWFLSISHNSAKWF